MRVARCMRWRAACWWTPESRGETTETYTLGASRWMGGGIGSGYFLPSRFVPLLPDGCWPGGWRSGTRVPVGGGVRGDQLRRDFHAIVLSCGATKPHDLPRARPRAPRDPLRHGRCGGRRLPNRGESARAWQGVDDRHGHLERNRFAGVDTARARARRLPRRRRADRRRLILAGDLRPRALEPRGRL